MTRLRALAFLAALLTALVLTVSVITSASSAPGDEVSRGRAFCTTSPLGFCTVEHSLGVAPALVVATGNSPSGGTPDIASQIVTDQFTARTFRARVINPKGNAITGKQVSFSWIAYLAETTPTPTDTATSSTPTPTGTAAACPGPAGQPDGADPFGGCWPGPSTTGVPAGTVLTVIAASVNVTTDGTIIDGQDIRGDLNIRANHVTVKNSRVLGGVVNIPKYCGALVCNQTDISFTDFEEDANHPGDNGEWMFGEFGSGVSCLRCDIHGGNLGVQVQTSGYTVTDSWVHDMWPASSAHKSAFGSNSADDVTARHNYLTCEVQGCSAALVMYSDGGPDDNWLVTRNHFDTEGSYCTYAGSGGSPATHITWTDNRYGRAFNPQCGIYGPTTGWQTDPTNTWAGNAFDDGVTVGP